MLCQPDPLLLDVFDALHKELLRALQERERLTDTRSDADQNMNGATLLTKIAGLKIVLAEMQAALQRRHSNVVH